MAKRILTVRAVESRKLKARKGERVDHLDRVVPGLAMRVTDRGHKSYVLITRYPGSGNPTRRVLGRPGRITLEQARDKARAWLELIEKGIDPAAEARKRRVDAEKHVTFAKLRDEFLARYRTRSGKPLKKIGEARRILEGDFRAWNNRAAADIDAQDVAAAVRVISDRGSPYQARNALQYVGCLYGWAVGNLEFGIKASPVAGLKPNVLGLGKEERTRVLSDAELGKIWDAAEEMAYPYGDVIKLLILTGQRELEIASMRREELDGTTTILTIPASRMKGDRTHEVPLTAGAAEIIKSLPTFAGPYLFTTTAGEKPINGFSKAKARVDKISGVSNWVLHDIRRTVRTRFSALPVEDVVREAVIAHARKGLHKVYDQHEYQAEKRRCLMLWEERLAKVLKPSQVTDLDEARAQRSVA